MPKTFSTEQLTQITDIVTAIINPIVVKLTQPITPVADNKMQVMHDSEGTESLDRTEGELIEQLKTEAPVMIRGRKGGEWFYPSEQKLNIIQNLRKNQKNYRDGVHQVK